MDSSGSQTETEIARASSSCFIPKNEHEDDAGAIRHLHRSAGLWPALTVNKHGRQSRQVMPAGGKAALRCDAGVNCAWTMRMIHGTLTNRGKRAFNAGGNRRKTNPHH
jgi:hypothetical protein